MEIKGGEVRKLSACHCMAQGFCAVTRIVELGSPSQDEDSAKAARTQGAHQRLSWTRQRAATTILTLFIPVLFIGPTHPGQSSPATRAPGLRSRAHAASMSLKSAPDLSYNVPPADECKGKTKAESDRHLGNLIVTHRSTLIRYPASTMAPPRQKNVVGMELGVGPAGTMVRTGLVLAPTHAQPPHAVAQIGPVLPPSPPA